MESLTSAHRLSHPGRYRNLRSHQPGSTRPGWRASSPSQDFSNGDQYYAQAGKIVDLPDRRVDRPGSEFLEWHLDEVFKAS
jgi:hypothetical protein